MSELLSEWTPSEATIELLKLNGIDIKHIERSETYLKTESELERIDDLDGYDSWNSFFIIFCIKAGGSLLKNM
ncbi:MAG: hypothetical protein GQ470_07445 [Gammaproteobacteria bacterium]|nr:hypothetical protein [Gammaproteobacteria bacterium]